MARAHASAGSAQPEALPDFASIVGRPFLARTAVSCISRRIRPGNGAPGPGIRALKRPDAGGMVGGLLVLLPETKFRRGTRACWVLVVPVLFGCSGPSFSSAKADGTAGGAHGTHDAGSGGRPSGSPDASAGATAESGGSVGAGGASAGGASAGGASAGGASAGGASAGGRTNRGGSGGRGPGSGGTRNQDASIPEAGAGGGASVPDAASVDAGPPPITVCPTAPPSLTSACAGHFACSYGDDPRISCRTIYSCDGSAWSTGGPSCAPLKSCIGDFVPAAMVGGPCPSGGDTCAFTMGLFCECIACTGQTVCKTAAWDCLPPPAAPCPASPPNEGQPCASGTSDCSYQPCDATDHVVAHCSSGTWSWQRGKCN